MTVTTPFSVPTIDISPYLLSPTSPAALQVISAVRSACLGTGFFQLVGHGISPSLQSQVFAASERFFALPLEEKLKLDRSHSVGASNRGYELIGGQGLQEDTLPDLKEGFYVGQEIPATDPRVRNNAFLMGPNLWPEEKLIGREVFREPMSRYYDVMKALSLKVLEIVSKGMEYKDVDIEEVMREFTGNDAVCSIRLLHYPPDPNRGTDEKQLGAGAHTDFGAITLLLQDMVGGLQIWDYGSEVWRDVEPVEGAYVVNVGDMLQMWTSGMYKSSLHRVLNKSGRDRYSVPFFFDGNVDFVLRPLDGSVREGGDLTVEGHMRERFASTYGRGKKTEGENFKA
ncbi:citrinin biosynthesis oxygenase CtnA [Hyaloscypha hepaticicola]|uniref:Citrinin biosynthesis oxygenase CtnA n=1 Tax=Hyaloscypha hepaticicola TaxID=2082293 RepID=A0A2J6Q9G9_9HELO|nr:citrinin biosynthesis oxygenase CtnA [Hyaloscypha hepaticicola]